MAPPKAYLYWWIDRLTRGVKIKGKSRLLWALRRSLSRRNDPFVWKMANGSNIAITPDDFAVGGGVGWSGFHDGKWEPHVERCLEQLLSPGEAAIDIGANVGYFSAVMARRVGPKGRVIAFEPVSTTRQLLLLTKQANQLSHLDVLPFAAGDTDSTVVIRFDPSLSCNASLYDRGDGGDAKTERVEVRTIDGLALKGPRFIARGASPWENEPGYQSRPEGADVDRRRGSFQGRRPPLAVNDNPSGVDQVILTVHIRLPRSGSASRPVP